MLNKLLLIVWLIFSFVVLSSVFIIEGSDDSHTNNILNMLLPVTLFSVHVYLVDSRIVWYTNVLKTLQLPSLRKWLNKIKIGLIIVMVGTLCDFIYRIYLTA